MTEICLRINFYFSFFGPPPLPKATQSINTHKIYSTYSQSHCNLTNLFTKPLQPNPKATQSINTHRFYSTYSQSHCNLTNLFTKPLQPAPQSNPKYQYPQILFNLFTKPLQLDQFIHKATATWPFIHKATATSRFYSHSRCHKHTLFTPLPPNPGKGKNIIFDFSPNLGHRPTGLDHQARPKHSGPHLCRGCVRPRGGAPSRHDANWPKTQQKKQKKTRIFKKKHQKLHRKSLMAGIFSVIWGAPRDTTSTKMARAAATTPERPPDDRNSP